LKEFGKVVSKLEANVLKTIKELARQPICEAVKLAETSEQCRKAQ
jgi:hypothetical protein